MATWRPTEDSPAELDTLFGLMADSVDGEIAGLAAEVGGFSAVRQIKSYKWANTTARNAQTGMTEGDTGDQADVDAQYRYTGTEWKRITPARGVATFSTGASGAATIAHGLGAVPSNVQLTKVYVNDTVNAVWEVSRGTVTSSTIQTVHHRMDNHSRLANTTVTVEWVAWP